MRSLLIAGASRMDAEAESTRRSDSAPQDRSGAAILLRRIEAEQRLRVSAPASMAAIDCRRALHRRRAKCAHFAPSITGKYGSGTVTRREGVEGGKEGGKGNERREGGSEGRKGRCGAMTGWTAARMSVSACIRARALAASFKEKEIQQAEKLEAQARARTRARALIHARAHRIQKDR